MPTRLRSRFTSILRGENILAVQRDGALDAAALHEVVHAVEDLSSVDLPQPDGPMKAVISLAGRRRLMSFSA